MLPGERAKLNSNHFPDGTTTMRDKVFNLLSISDVADARSALPTVGVALNTCDAILKVADFLLRHRQDSFVLCAQNCLESVREEIYIERYLKLVAAKGSEWILANRNSIEFADVMQRNAQCSFSDERTQAEIIAQLNLAEEVLRIPCDDRTALLETRKIALPDGANSLGFRQRVSRISS